MIKIGLFNKVNDIPLNFKFLIIYVLCLLMPILCIHAIFLDRFTKIVREREENNYKISMDRAKADINALVEGCIAVSHSILTDRILYDLLDKPYETSSEYYEVYDSVLRNRLIMYTAAYNYIRSIGIYVDNPSIRTGGTYYSTDAAVKEMCWYKAIVSSGESVLIEAYIGPSQSIPTRSLQYLSILRNYREYPAQSSRDKILKVDMDVEKLYSILKREKDYLSFYLINRDGYIVCSSDNPYKFDVDNGLLRFSPDMLPQDGLLFQSDLGDALYLKGWKLIGSANRERLSKSLKETTRFVFLLALSSIPVSFLLMFIIVRSYNYRLKKLSKHMLKFRDGQFDLIEINEGKDEIGGVIRNFNLMAAKINRLINDVYKLELQKKDLELERVRAEISFLQSQMNPHFLFNTLNALLVVCVKNSYTEVIEIIKYMSKTLRRLLSWKEDLVTIEEELSFTEMYLKIEKFRFGDKFEYSVSIDEKLLRHKVPKMSLQPLVENACKHGMQSIRGVGMVHVCIAMAEEGLCVRVEDNGTGMDGLKLDEVLQNITGREELNAGIGIRNVYRRLKLYYGEEVLFHIESCLNAGTRIYFIIPREKLWPVQVPS